MEELIKYLTEQKAEREQKREAYDLAVKRFEDAKAELESFGDVGDIDNEIAKLTGFIGKLCEKEEEAALDGGVVDEFAVTEEA